MTKKSMTKKRKKSTSNAAESTSIKSTQSKTKKSRQQSATLAAAEKIRELIFNGELVADSNHLETELAERLGMSRTPVREATLMLQATGLLEVKPRKGIKVCGISTSDIAEIFDVIEELECMAAKRAALANYANEDLVIMQKAIDDMDSALEQKDRTAWAIADEAFHNELIRLGNNSRVKQFASCANDQIHRARRITLNMRPLPTKANDMHRKVYKAIEKGDVQTAIEAHRKHTSDTKELLIGLLDLAGLKRI